MFDLGWTELLLIGVVALIVVGPKDLPGMFKQLGKFTGKAKGMAREFSRAMEAAADESGVNEVQKDIKAMTSSKNLGLDDLKDAAKMDSWKPGSETAKLAEERADAAKKIHDATAKRESDRRAADAKAKVDAKTATSSSKQKPQKASATLTDAVKAAKDTSGKGDT